MSFSQYIKNEILSYGVTGFDIWMAIFESGASRDFFPISENKLDQFTLQRGEKGSPFPFPDIAVRLLLMVIDKLAKGEAPVILPRYYELTIEEAAQAFNFPTQELQRIIKQNTIPSKTEEGKQTVIAQDVIDYKINETKKHLNENSKFIYFEPRDIISTYSSSLSLQNLTNSEFDSEDLYFLKKRINAIESLKITKNTLSIACKILSQMTIAHTLMSYPIDMDINEEEAAEILGYPRDFTIKLLQDKLIPFRREGNCYFIALSDLMNYKKIRDKDRLEAFQEMTDLWVDHLEIENGDK